MASWCFDPIAAHRGELTEALTAVSFDDAWSTYICLSENIDSEREVNARFVHAKLEELSGRRESALSEFRNLR